MTEHRFCALLSFLMYVALRPTVDCSAGKVKSKKVIQNEIQAIIRQITASVTFLPLLQEPCTFDLLVYAYNEAEVPTTWEETAPKMLQNKTEVRLRSFTTTVHKVEAMVSYDNDDDDDDC